MKRVKEKVAAGGLLGYNTRPLRDNVVREMANSKHKPAVKKPATKKSAAARPAKKPAAKKPIHKPAAKKPARPAPVKSTKKAAPHKPASAQKKGKMSAVIEKD